MKSVKKQRGIILIQNLIRKVIAIKRAIALRSVYPEILLVKINSMEGLNVSDANASDLVGYVGCGMLEEGSSSPSPDGTSISQIALSRVRLSCLFKLEKLSVKESSDVAMTSASKSSPIISVTIVDQASPSKDDCLGQVR